MVVYEVTLVGNIFYGFLLSMSDFCANVAIEGSESNIRISRTDVFKIGVVIRRLFCSWPLSDC